MKKNNQRVVLTKRLLREALEQLLAKKSLSDVSVSELCAQAGVNRSTFYSHYGNVGDILHEMEDVQVEAISARLQELSSAGEVTLSLRVESICSYLRENASTFRLLFSIRSEASDFAERLLGLGAQNAPALDAMLAGYDRETRKLLTSYIVEGTYSLVRIWLLDDISKTPAEMGVLAEKIALHGWASAETRR